jgi:hypothetical protein
MIGVSTTFECQWCGARTTADPVLQDANNFSRFVTKIPDNWVVRAGGHEFIRLYAGGPDTMPYIFCCRDHMSRYEDAERKTAWEADRVGKLAATAAFTEGMKTILTEAMGAVTALAKIEVDDDGGA